MSADFAFEVNELAKTLRDVVDTATGKLNFVFDDIARICTTNALRVCETDDMEKLRSFLPYLLTLCSKGGFSHWLDLSPGHVEIHSGFQHCLDEADCRHVNYCHSSYQDDARCMRIE